MVQVLGADGAEVDAAMTRLGIAHVQVGQVALRDLCGVDKGIAARWNERNVHLMPHGGAAVIRGVCAALARAGLEEARHVDARASYPEARSDIEARMLAGLARTASPLAVDLLLDQPRRWVAADGATGDGRTEPSVALRALTEPAAAQLKRLIDPPLVVAVGPPNVGKSSLVNALAGRRVAIVADEPGTTRDHVGVMIDMGGLVVRYVDTPGVRETRDPIEAEAARLAREVAERADLVLLCGDVTSGPVAGPPGVDSLLVATRADLGTPGFRHDAAVSALNGRGIPGLAGLIRERLVPAAALEDPRPWKFWE